MAYKLSKSGRLIVPEHEGVRGYRPADADRWKRHLDWREKQPKPKLAVTSVQTPIAGGWSNTAVFGSAVSSGSTVVAAITTNGTNNAVLTTPTGGITDDKGNTYTTLTQQNAGPTTNYTRILSVICYCINVTNGPKTLNDLIQTKQRDLRIIKIVRKFFSLL